jgi:hypothetical protein
VARSAVFFLAISAGANSALSQDQDKALQPDDMIVDNYYVAAADKPPASSACRGVLNYLNRPRSLALSGTWDFISTPYNLLWQRELDDGSFAFPFTLGDIPPAPASSDRVIADINNDGTTETVFRTANIIRGVVYTELSVLRAGKSESSTEAGDYIDLGVKDVMPTDPLNITPRSESGDFYLMDLLQIDDRIYVLAASAFGIPRNAVFLFTVDQDMALHVACVLKFHSRN